MSPPQGRTTPSHPPASTTPTAYVRVQFDMPADKLALLEQLAEEGGLATRKELFGNALSLLKWAAHQVKSGRTISAIDDSGGPVIQLHMPFLDALHRP